MFGELLEWLNMSLSKSDKVKAFGGSNPPLSANRSRILTVMLECDFSISVLKVLLGSLFLHKKYNTLKHTT